jgi:hypothetical protein
MKGRRERKRNADCRAFQYEAPVPVLTREVRKPGKTGRGTLSLMSASSTLRKVAGDLRYRPLPALVGSRIVVTGFDAVETALRAAVRAAGLEPGPFDPGNLRGAIAKYDLIDVCFEVAPSALENVETRRGISLLRELGFVDSATGEHREAAERASSVAHQRGHSSGRVLDVDLTPDDSAEAMMEGSCLDVLAGDIDAGSVCIRLVLTSETPRDRTDPAVLRQMIRLELPSAYFPRPFVIDDACVTNAKSIWFNKHFYL